MKLPDAREHIREFTLLSIYGGMCTGDYDGDGLIDFYVTSPAGGNRLYKNLGNFRFRDVTAEAGVASPDMQGSGATFVDVDNDGDLDIYACAYNGENRLFVNEGPAANGQVRFAEKAHDAGLAFRGGSMTMAFADIDGDGDLDGYLATTAIQPPPGVRFSVHFEGKKPVVDDAVREYWDLIYLPGDRAHRTEAGQFDHLYRNDNGRFTDITKDSGIDGPYFTLAATWWDYNRDGRPDVYVSNDFMGPDRLYCNEGGGHFTNVGPEALPHTPWFSMGTDVADVNNDGLIDLFATDMSARDHFRRVMMSGTLEEGRRVVETLAPPQEMRNALFLNSGVSRMFEAARQYGVDSSDWTWNPRLADFDNDGFVDLFVTTGVLRDTMNSDLGSQANASFAPGSDAWRNFWAQKEMRKEANIVFKNRDGRGFDDIGRAWGLDRVGVSYGAVTADFDNDGDLDLLVNNADVPLSIYRNNAGGKSIRVKLRGQESNRFGIGATITVNAGGRRQAQYVTLARGWLSAIDPAVHFGLGAAERVDRLTVQWPSGRVQRFDALPAGQTYVITEPVGATAASGSPADNPPASSDEPPTKPMFTPVAQAPPVVHQEESFDDFAQQPLLPYRLSEPGPALAWGDIDGDGDVDAFLGGPRSKPSRLLLNDGKGHLTAASTRFPESNLQRESAAAALFDADGDGDLDLFVATGSVEQPKDDPAYRDALYVNDGHGTFAPAPDDAVPDVRDSGSVVAPADFDQDGDVDLFVGSRSVPGEYPLPPENRLLINDGGQFHDAAPDAVKNSGMVTDAAWADADGDGWLELVVTTDWGPVRLFHNQRGTLVEQTEAAGLAARTGWWLAIAPGDVDGDGDVDFVVANFGRNTPYHAKPDAPIEMYYGDVEGLGTPRLIEVITEGGAKFPRRELYTLKPALPTIGAIFPSFAAFAAASLEKIFAPDRLSQAVHLSANELDSGILINDGQARFRFTPLPDVAQLAPTLDVDLADLNGDDRPDLVLAQNMLNFNREIGRLDGGVSLVLLGSPQGEFQPLWPNASGVVVTGQARSVSAKDLNGDGRGDLAFGVQGPIAVYQNDARR